MIYVAMFDEVGEVTAIFKIAQNPPVGANLCQLRGRHSLRFLPVFNGYAAKMLRKEVQFQEILPVFR